MRVGDYVRTKYGIKRITTIVCGQDIRFDNTEGFDEELLNYHNYDGISNNSHIWEEIVIGEPSPNIIDLIEVGDYVNREKVLFITKNGNTRLEVVCSDGKNMLGWRSYKEKEFKSIVTKEQFKSMEYEVK